jgi:hypothetical protein
MIKHNNLQRGAMFGLDARIALAVFGVLAIVAGATILLSLDSIRAKALAKEMDETGKAVEALVYDIKADLYPSLTQPSPKNAFTALFDDSVLREKDGLRAKWLGPYIKATNTVHARYGDMLVEARQEAHAQACDPGADCYLWVTYSKVKTDVAQEVNDIIDGREDSPAASGQVQWAAGEGDTVVLSYRAAKTLSYSGD